MTKEESGRRLTARAEAKGLSAYAIARKLGISHTTAYGWLGGKFKPGLEHLPALAQVLEVPMSEISDRTAALSEEQQRQLAEAVVQVALAALERSNLMALTEERIGGPAAWASEHERTAVAGITPAALKTLLDDLAEGDFLALPPQRMVELIRSFLNEKQRSAPLEEANPNSP